MKKSEIFWASVLLIVLILSGFFCFPLCMIILAVSTYILIGDVLEATMDPKKKYEVMALYNAIYVVIANFCIYRNLLSIFL